MFEHSALGTPRVGLERWLTNHDTVQIGHVTNGTLSRTDATR